MQTLRRRASRQLDQDDAKLIWTLHQRGLFQHQIAAEMGVNQGRISEILTGKRFAEASPQLRLL